MLKNSIINKFIVILIIVAILPLGIVGYFVSKNFKATVSEVTKKTEEMGRRNLQSARDIGSAVIKDIVSQLDKKSTEAIEVRTVELASQIARFLNERDRDVINLSVHKPAAELYLNFIKNNSKEVILPTEPGKPAADENKEKSISWENPDNRENWHHVPPYHYKKISKPLYKEITFVGLDGKELIKVKNGKISHKLKDVSLKKNTYCKAEDYFTAAVKLKKNELYVSKVIGAYVKGWLYKDDEGLKVKAESAYAGKENPQGKRFEGIIRWVVPVYRKNKKIGYLTMALDHVHVMEFADHIIPTEERFSDIADAGSGNYAFLWDVDNQNISHPRDFFICGYDPETGREVPGWLSQKTYNEFKKSGLSLDEFVASLPDFKNFTLKKKGSAEQRQSGQIGLDCRILDQAPQCQGWSRGTEDGGSGSFLIFWSGLWKLTTYATIPYYTGQYGKSLRGFGYVTIGANVKDFHKAAVVTKKNIEASIKRQEQDIDSVMSATKELISRYFSKQYNQLIFLLFVVVFAVIIVAVLLSLTFTRPLKRLMEGAKAIGRGHYNQNIEVKSGDEIGQLGESFNKMAYDIAETNKRLCLEIEDRLKTEQALQSSENRYRDIFEHGVEGIFQSTADGDLINANPRMAKIFGYESPESIIADVTNIGKQLYIYSSHRDEYMKEMQENGIVSGFEIEVYKKNKEKAWISVNARAVRGKDGKIEYIEGFLIDITERKKAEHDKDELQNRLIRSKKMEALGLLAGGVAHDLNNVLSGIVGYPDLILMDLPEDSPLRKPIMAMQDSGKKAAAIVQDLLSLARRGVTHTEVLDLNEIIREYLNSPEYKNLLLYHSEILVEANLAPDLLHMSGSSVHLKKTVMNLISNAAEALPGGGKIMVSTENRYVDLPIKGYDHIQEGDFVLLTIKDNGIGIDYEDIKRIFEPFYTKKTMGRSGTGLGMSVVWGTVQDHNGYINIESTPGKETTFQLYFPATRDEVDIKRESLSVEDYIGNGESILVVDDVPRQRAVATSLLARLQYRVVVVASGEEAIEYMKDNSVDLLLLDMIMVPGIDGLDTYREILKMHPGQKAIIASGFSENDRVKKAQALGAGEYIRKPYTLEKLGLAVKCELERT